MPHISKSHEQFVKEVHENHPEIVVISDYKNTRTCLLASCKICGHNWKGRPDHIRKNGCPKCNIEDGIKKRTKCHQDYLNNLQSKNIIDIIPMEEYKNSRTKILHRSLVCGHEWKSTPSNILFGNNCPICSGATLVKGANDIWTTNPQIAKMLLNPEDGYKYTVASHKRVDWVCPNCGKTVINKKIRYVNERGFPCPFCGDGKSLPSKFIAQILSDLNINFRSEKRFKWSGRKAYDFYIPEKNCIIEVHGEQHYRYCFAGKTLKEEQQNDEFKRSIALKNGINHYIEINARSSNFNWLRDKTINSGLSILYDLLDIKLEDCYIKACKSRLIEACELYNKGTSLKQIMKLLDISKSTVNIYLLRGTSLGICNYQRGSYYTKVICLTTNEIFDSIKEAQEHYHLNRISEVCQRKTQICGKHPTTGENLRWQYYDEYLRSVQENTPSSI